MYKQCPQGYKYLCPYEAYIWEEKKNKWFWRTQEIKFNNEKSKYSIMHRQKSTNIDEILKEKRISDKQILLLWIPEWVHHYAWFLTHIAIVMWRYLFPDISRFVWSWGKHLSQSLIPRFRACPVFQPLRIFKPIERKSQEWDPGSVFFLFSSPLHYPLLTMRI